MLRGFDNIRSHSTEKTSVTEIDDLIDFLAEQDAVRSANAKTPFFFSIDEDKLSAFVENINLLSRAEREVFDLYVKGFKAAEIADQLHLAMSTVKTHNGRINRKLGVTSRVEMMVYVSAMQGHGML